MKEFEVQTQKEILNQMLALYEARCPYYYNHDVSAKQSARAILEIAALSMHTMQLQMKLLMQNAIPVSGSVTAPTKKYTYPDGFVSSARPPYDGYYFDLRDANGLVDSTWQWDDKNEVWIQLSGTIRGANVGNISTTGTTFPVNVFGNVSAKIKEKGDLIREFDKLTQAKVEPVCECGAEATKSTMHSKWCPKH